MPESRSTRSTDFGDRDRGGEGLLDSYIVEPLESEVRRVGLDVALEVHVVAGLEVVAVEVPAQAEVHERGDWKKKVTVTRLRKKEWALDRSCSYRVVSAVMFLSTIV